MQPEKLTLKSQEALSEAQRLARESSHQEMDGDHLLLALLGQSESLVPELLARIGVPPAKIQPDLGKELARRHKIQGGRVVRVAGVREREKSPVAGVAGALGFPARPTPARFGKGTRAASQNPRR